MEVPPQGATSPSKSERKKHNKKIKQKKQNPAILETAGVSLNFAILQF
jgi:hypothetical protein